MKIEVTHQDMYEKGYREGYGKAMYEVEQKGLLVEWIPCSERLPDKEGNYLVSGKWASGKLAVDSCEYKIDYDGGYFRASHSFDVLAWMPLPEPYKREGEAE